MAEASGAIVAISSHVARGAVGNRAMVFALERLGFTVWSVPTVILPHHPGHGRAERIVLDPDRFAALLEALVEDGRATGVAGIVSGYLGSAGQVEAVARFVEAVREARPDCLYLCDPVIGDAGALYVDVPIAELVRDRLLTLADVATPNAFECAWLAGDDDGADPDLALSATMLPPAVVLVTSAPALLRGHIGNLLVEEDGSWLLEHPALPNAAKGTGDLLSALVLAHRLQGRAWPEASRLALSSVFEIASATAEAGADELLLAQYQDALTAPRSPVGLRRVGA
jgi:pyridoxine kinase